MTAQSVALMTHQSVGASLMTHQSVAKLVSVHIICVLINGGRGRTVEFIFAGACNVHKKDYKGIN